MAVDYYRDLGYTVHEVGKPYDLGVSKCDEEFHVEVKGSQGSADEVDLTSNEVRHAHGHRTELVVIDQIHCERQADGTLVTSGGRFRRSLNWSPADQDLRPTAFRYRLPNDGSLEVLERPGRSWRWPR